MFFISSDVASCETSDRVIESRASDVTYSQGYVAESYYTDDWIKHRLILAIHLGVITVEI